MLLSVLKNYRLPCILLNLFDPVLFELLLEPFTEILIKAWFTNPAPTFMGICVNLTR